MRLVSGKHTEWELLSDLSEWWILIFSQCLMSVLVFWQRSWEESAVSRWWHVVLTCQHSCMNQRINCVKIIWLSLIFEFWSCSCLAVKEKLFKRWTEQFWAWILSEFALKMMCFWLDKKARTHTQLTQLIIIQNLVKTHSQHVQ